MPPTAMLFSLLNLCCTDPPGQTVIPGSYVNSPPQRKDRRDAGKQQVVRVRFFQCSHVIEMAETIFGNANDLSKTAT
jgi:hypothetical protein